MNMKKTCLAAGACLASIAVRANAAMPIAVSLDGGDVVASVPAGTLDETSALYLVWDDADRGADLADWPAANRVKCDVGRDGARPSQCRINRGKVAPGQVFRVLATGKVRLLEEGGWVYVGKNQYVDTGIKATDVHGLSVTFQYSPNDYQKAEKNAWASLIGSLPTDDFAIGRKANGADGQFYMRYRGESLKADGKTPDLMFALGDFSVPHTIALANRTATLDGKTVTSDLAAGSIGANTDAGTILLGCSWNDDCNRGLSQRYCHAKWFSARLDDANGKALVNLVPARRGGEGVLWDTVSRKVFANAGTGALAFSGKAGAELEGTEAVCAASCAVVVGNTEIVGKARFTLLTDRMIRCEWSEDGSFEDRPSLTFVNRAMPPVKHTCTRTGDGAVIETEKMRVEWKGGAFNEKNLFVSLGSRRGATLPPVAVLDDDKENLLGTMRTIDARSSIKDLLPRMEKGVLSRRGVAVVDDTQKPLFVKGGDYWKEWVEERPRREKGAYRDLTVFAYGHDYKGCLGDYVKVAGRIPLPPRWAFGYWWSRFWNDTESDYRQAVRDMKSVGIPVDVCVIEMYWHENWDIAERPDMLQPLGGQMWGWGGYTWNKRYFPDPAGMFRFLHDEGLHAPLNMHPACGIPDCEDVFPRFAKDYGWKGKGIIPFRGDEERWAEIYFKDIIEPLEALGADCFWLDWQQWLMSKGKPTLSNTFWLNHLFATHDARRVRVNAPYQPHGGAACNQAAKRPIIYHRWGGLGSHRYQIGFSGDGESSWRMLESIPWFTATASNVGYGYWGHDLGGHNRPQFKREENGELLTRWMQCGVFTPIFRTHSAKDSLLERRPWKYADHFFILRETYRLRYRLAPYIYTAARQAYDTGVCLCRPMYYDWPEEDAAYEAINQYMFGDDILVAPVTKPVDPVTKEAEVEVWLPKGTWYDVSRGEIVEGGHKLTRGYTVEETPWFVKAGAVIPMYPDSVNRLGNPGTDDMVLFCVPQAARRVEVNAPYQTSIYEDGGDNADYATNYRRTAIRREGNRVTIAPRKGAYTLKFPLAAVPRVVKVNGKESAWEYDAEDLAVVVKTPPQDGTRETVVELVYSGGPRFVAASDGTKPVPPVAVLSGLKGEYTRVAALTDEFRLALAGRGWPKAAANLPTSWQVVWKTRDALAAHPADAQRLLAERDAALKEFAEKDWPRLEKTFAPEFITRMRGYLHRAGEM
ncbi:MAG: hypothetical protein J6T51_01545 [Kiritimatiellae bacterium]|nr:hypothetical protein [Kiritimatiellia bacterium]